MRSKTIALSAALGTLAIAVLVGLFSRAAGRQGEGRMPDVENHDEGLARFGRHLDMIGNAPVRIRVLDGVTGKPIAGARVLHGSPDEVKDPAWRQFAALEERHPDTRSYYTAVTDSDGVATLRVIVQYSLPRAPAFWDPPTESPVGVLVEAEGYVAVYRSEDQGAWRHTAVHGASSEDPSSYSYRASSYTYDFGDVELLRE